LGRASDLWTGQSPLGYRRYPAEMVNRILFYQIGPVAGFTFEDVAGLLRLVHQVSDWCSGVAIKMGRRQGGPSRTGGRKEHIWIDT